MKWSDPEKATDTSADASVGGLFECNTQGYLDLVKKGTKLALSGITMVNSIIRLAMDIVTLNYLAIATGLAYEFVISSNDWVGYAISALYYFGLEYDFGDYVCQGFGYVYIGIYYLELIVSFGADAGLLEPEDASA